MKTDTFHGTFQACVSVHYCPLANAVIKGKPVLLPVCRSQWACLAMRRRCWTNRWARMRSRQSSTASACPTTSARQCCSRSSSCVWGRSSPHPPSCLTVSSRSGLGETCFQSLLSPWFEKRGLSDEHVCPSVLCPLSVSGAEHLNC